MSHAEAVIIVSTWPAGEDPGPAASTLVEERLAACVNVLPPMESVYLWKNTVERTQERQLTIKTTRGRVDALLARLKQLHPYEVPEALVIPVTGGAEQYLAWIADCVASSRAE
jgi:periplasmic divalent cation tolerance protein